MNDTTDATTRPPEADGFEAQRLRTIADMRRSSDDRLVAGVCAGAARYLNIDPVVVRILIAVMTLVGGAGLILYVAVWFLVPSDDAAKSVAADWFRLDENEERVRVGGLVIAAVVAVLSVVGDSGWGWGGSFPWWLIAPALLIYVFVVRPNRRRDRQATEQVGTPLEGDRGEAFTTTKVAKVREPKSRALLGLTVSIAAIAVAVTRIVAETNGGDTPWTTYVAVALTVVGLGLLVSTFWGFPGPLVLLGVVLAVVLTIGSALPSGRIGQQRFTPDSAAEVDISYTHGVGEMVVDLTEVSDPDELLGRVMTIDAGVGKTQLIVPDALNVDIRTELTAGDVRVFDKNQNGTDLRLDRERVVDADSPSLTVDIDQTVGQIEVISQ